MTAPATTGGTARSSAADLPDLLYGDAETELRAAVRSLLDDRGGWREVLARTETAETYDTGLWRTLAADLGCAGLLIPEASGGAGASYREAAVVAEETGRAVAPVPYLGSAVVATAALLAAGGSGPSGSGVSQGAAPRATMTCWPRWPTAPPPRRWPCRSRPRPGPGRSPRSGWARPRPARRTAATCSAGP